MGDLLNHDPGRHVAWHTGPIGLDAFHFITHTPVEQASSVLCCCPTQAKQYTLQCLATLQSNFFNQGHCVVLRSDYLQMSEHGLLGLNSVVLFIPYDCVHTCVCPTAKLCSLQGCTLYSNYGNKSNEELILGYGFALPHNEADFFHVMVGLAGTSKPEPGGDYCCTVIFLSLILLVTLWHFLELRVWHRVYMVQGKIYGGVCLLCSRVL